MEITLTVEELDLLIDVLGSKIRDANERTYHNLDAARRAMEALPRYDNLRERLEVVRHPRYTEVPLTFILARVD